MQCRACGLKWSLCILLFGVCVFVVNQPAARGSVLHQSGKCCVWKEKPFTWCVAHFIRGPASAAQTFEAPSPLREAVALFVLLLGPAPLWSPRGGWTLPKA